MPPEHNQHINHALSQMNLSDKELLLILHTKFDSIEQTFESRFEELEEDMKKLSASQEEVESLNQKITVIQTTMALQKEYQERGHNNQMRWIAIISILMVLIQILIAVFDYKVKVLPSK